MATYSHREIISRRIEYVIPAAQPWGACLADMRAAIEAAALHFGRAHNIPANVQIPDDSLRFTPRDDEIIISFTVEDAAPRPDIPPQRDGERLIRPVPAPLTPDGRARCISQYAADGTYHQCERNRDHAGYHRATGYQWLNGDQA